MTRTSTVLLQVVIALIGVGALAFLLWEPHLEGRNARATLFQIYFNDPFLAYVYVGSGSFFAVLYQAFKVLRYASEDRFFTQAAANRLRSMKHCAMAIIGFVAVGEVFIMLGDSDDRAGGVFMGILIAIGSLVIASAAAMFERRVHGALELKPESDLNV